jgi:hypothetical protein
MAYPDAAWERAMTVQSRCRQRQLASCTASPARLQREMSQSLPFVAFDARLAKAARHEGLTVVPVSKGRR